MYDFSPSIWNSFTLVCFFKKLKLLKQSWANKKFQIELDVI